MTPVSSSSKWWYHPEVVYAWFISHIKCICTIKFWHPLFILYKPYSRWYHPIIHHLNNGTTRKVSIKFHQSYVMHLYPKKCESLILFLYKPRHPFFFHYDASLTVHYVINVHNLDISCLFQKDVDVKNWFMPVFKILLKFLVFLVCKISRFLCGKWNKVQPLP